MVSKYFRCKFPDVKTEFHSCCRVCIMVRCGVVVGEVDEVMLVLCDMAPVLRAALRCVPQFRVPNTLFSGWDREEQLSYVRRIKIKRPNSADI